MVGVSMSGRILRSIRLDRLSLLLQETINGIKLSLHIDSTFLFTLSLRLAFPTFSISLWREVLTIVSTVDKFFIKQLLSHVLHLDFISLVSPAHVAYILNLLNQSTQTCLDMVVPSEFGQYLPVLALNVTNIEIVFWCILLTDLGSLGSEILILILSLTLGWDQS